MKLKMYVWSGWMPDYTGGLAIVVAVTPDEAKQNLFDTFISQKGYPPQEVGEKEIMDDYHNLRDPEIILLQKGVVLRVEGGG